jgi:hypothetical protein
MREKKVLPALNSRREKLPPADHLQAFLDMALDALLEVMDTDTGWLLLLAPGGEEPLAAAWRGCSEDMKQEASYPVQWKAGCALIVPDLSKERGFTAFTNAGLVSLIALRLKTGPFLEFLGAASRKPAAFSSESAEVLKLTASLIGAALERGGFNRGVADLAAGQPHPPTSDLKEFERIAAIAGERYREVRQAMERAVDRARWIDRKFTQATIELLKETARWEDLLKQYEAESTREAATAAETSPETAGPETAAPEAQEPAEAPEAKPEETPSEAAAAEEAADLTFMEHTDRMQAFRKTHANL